LDRFGSTTDATSIELAGHGDGTTITDALENEQLIASTTPSTSLFEDKNDSSFESTVSSTTAEPSTTTRQAKTTTTSQSTTSTTTSKSPSTANLFAIPSDFPRPAFLPQDDNNGSGIVLKIN
jgi:hypothetical protein